MKALIVVDVQQDFCPGGTLPVPKGDEIIPIINKLLPKFDLIIFTKDCHPYNHKSFASQYKNKKIFDKITLNSIEQVLWPDHCVQETQGAEFNTDLDLSKCKKDFYIFKKGMDPKVDSYSAFFDNEKKNSTGLLEFLKDKKITEVYICGLAFEYCVQFTAIDAVESGFKTIVIEDVTRPINEDINEILKNFKEAGIYFIESWEL